MISKAPQKPNSPTKRRNRNAIIRAFVSLLSEKHFAEIKTQDVIERAEIAKSTFYQYFRHKNDLRDALVESFAIECENLFLAIKALKKKEAKEQKIILFASRNKEIFQSLFQLEDGSYSLRRSVWDSFAEIHEGADSLKKDVEMAVYLLYLKRVLLEKGLCTTATLRRQVLSADEKSQIFEIFG